MINSHLFSTFVESSLDVLAHISEGATDTAPVEVQENKCADGSSSACPLVVEDGNRKNLSRSSRALFVPCPPFDHSK